MIRHFKDRDTQAVAELRHVGRFPPDIQRRAQRKLALLNKAIRLEDLASPPGNQLEALSRERSGQHSIRINDQWRICFVWYEGDAFQVEIVDYH